MTLDSTSLTARATSGWQGFDPLIDIRGSVKPSGSSAAGFTRYGRKKREARPQHDWRRGTHEKSVCATKGGVVTLFSRRATRSAFRNVVGKSPLLVILGSASHFLTLVCNAGVAELADALDSKSRGLRVMRVRPPPPAPRSNRLLKDLAAIVVVPVTLPADRSQFFSFQPLVDIEFFAKSGAYGLMNA